MDEDEELIEAIKDMPEYEKNDESQSKSKKKPATETEEVYDEEDTEGDEIDKVDPEEEEEHDYEEDTEDNDILNQKVKVKIGDEETEVTVDELTKGYMRQNDYTKKTQEASSIKNAHLEGAKRVQQLCDLIETSIDESIFVTEEKQLKELLESVDINDLDDQGLVAYQKTKLKYDTLRSQNAQRKADAESLREVQKQEKERLLAAIKKEEDKKIALAISDYSDPHKREADQKRISNYLSSLYGEHAEKLANSVIDHRDYLNLHYAAIGYEYSHNKKPVKAIKQLKNIRNGGARSDMSEPSESRNAKKLLTNIKLRGVGAEASPEEIQKIIMSRL